MTRVAASTLALAAALSGHGCGQEAGPPPTRAVSLHYRVEGMHCDGCVQAITDKVKRAEGVLDCRVTLEPARADVTVREASQGAAVRKAIERLGYTVTPLADDAAPAPPASK